MIYYAPSCSKISCRSESRLQSDNPRSRKNDVSGAAGGFLPQKRGWELGLHPTRFQPGGRRTWQGSRHCFQGDAPIIIASVALVLLSLVGHRGAHLPVQRRATAFGRAGQQQPWCCARATRAAGMQLNLSLTHRRARGHRWADQPHLLRNPPATHITTCITTVSTGRRWLPQPLIILVQEFTSAATAAYHVSGRQQLRPQAAPIQVQRGRHQTQAAGSRAADWRGGSEQLPKSRHPVALHQL